MTDSSLSQLLLVQHGELSCDCRWYTSSCLCQWFFFATKHFLLLWLFVFFCQRLLELVRVDGNCTQHEVEFRLLGDHTQIIHKEEVYSEPVLVLSEPQANDMGSDGTGGAEPTIAGGSTAWDLTRSDERRLQELRRDDDTSAERWLLEEKYKRFIDAGLVKLNEMSSDDRNRNSGGCGRFLNRCRGIAKHAAGVSLGALPAGVARAPARCLLLVCGVALTMLLYSADGGESRSGSSSTAAPMAPPSVIHAFVFFIAEHQDVMLTLTAVIAVLSAVLDRTPIAPSPAASSSPPAAQQHRGVGATTANPTKLGNSNSSFTTRLPRIVVSVRDRCLQFVPSAICSRVIRPVLVRSRPPPCSVAASTGLLCAMVLLCGCFLTASVIALVALPVQPTASSPQQSRGFPLQRGVASGLVCCLLTTGIAISSLTMLLAQRRMRASSDGSIVGGGDAVNDIGSTKAAATGTVPSPVSFTATMRERSPMMTPSPQASANSGTGTPRGATGEADRMLL